MTELQNWLMIILTLFGAIAGLLVLAWAIMSYYLTRSEAKDVRTQEAKQKADIKIFHLEKENVLKSISALAEVMTEFRITQKEQNTSVQKLTVFVEKIDTRLDAIEHYSRGSVIQTGDGTILDPSKVNKKR
jgi:hypothetical protein